MKRKFAFAAAVALGASAFAAPALASPTYPAAVAKALELPCEPACTLCHTRPTGGFATVNTPFGRSARMQQGLECCKPDELGAVLEALRTSDVDSDEDGTGDVDELEALTDPNTADDRDLDCTATSDASSGCTVTSARSATDATSWLAIGGLFASLLLRVRRRLHKERGGSSAHSSW